MIVVTVDEVRAAIATSILGVTHDAVTLGDIELHAHQRDALARVRRLLEEHRGALLADDVGLGKTYVALAVARDARRALVIAPAAVRDVWLGGAARAGVPITFASVQSLARAAPGTAPFDLVIIDEAHHLRSRATQRFAAAIALCRDARVLLLSATPIQNRLDDLRNVLSLFLGTRALALPVEDLAGFVIRRLEEDLADHARPILPRVSPAVALPAVRDLDCLDRIVALPPPVPPAGGGVGGALLTYTLVRQWASSRAALRGALRRRLARAHAMEDVLAAGRLPTAAELAAWCFADGAQQLSLPDLVVQALAPEADAMLDQVRAHSRAVGELLGWLNTSVDPDEQRAATLRRVLEAHPRERVVAFTEYADTAAVLYRMLAPNSRAALSSRGGVRIAGGRITRRELLASFGPDGGKRPRDSDRIDVLLTTDVLSEGVDMQGASVAVHLDLAWNPARLEQRVGRLRRPGAARDRVAVYVMPPPVPAERLLQLEQRLRAKIAVASRTIGVRGAILLGLSGSGDQAAARREERIASLLRDWLPLGLVRDTFTETSAAAPVRGATVRSTMNGAIACVRRDGAAELIACKGAQISDSRDLVEEVLRAANGPVIHADGDALDEMCRRLGDWLARRTVGSVVSLPEIKVAQSRRTVLRRVEGIGRRAPRHRQAGIAALMQAARSAARATLSAGAEQVLGELASADLDDDAWLHAMREFASLHARAAPPPRILAVLLLRADAVPPTGAFSG